MKGTAKRLYELGQELRRAEEEVRRIKQNVRELLGVEELTSYGSPIKVDWQMIKTGAHARFNHSRFVDNED